MSFRAAVVTFPGSNCDRDLAVALEQVSGVAPHRVWHGDADLEAMCRQLLANLVIENYRIEKLETA